MKYGRLDVGAYGRLPYAHTPVRPYAHKRRTPRCDPRGSRIRSGEGFMKPSRIMRPSPPTYRLPRTGGVTSVTDYRTHSKDLLAQKRSSPSRQVASIFHKGNLETNTQTVNQWISDYSLALHSSSSGESAHSRSTDPDGFISYSRSAFSS